MLARVPRCKHVLAAGSVAVGQAQCGVGQAQCVHCVAHCLRCVHHFFGLSLSHVSTLLMTSFDSLYHISQLSQLSLSNVSTLFMTSLDSLCHTMSLSLSHVLTHSRQCLSHVLTLSITCLDITYHHILRYQDHILRYHHILIDGHDTSRYGGYHIGLQRVYHLS